MPQCNQYGCLHISIAPPPNHGQQHDLHMIGGDIKQKTCRARAERTFAATKTRVRRCSSFAIKPATLPGIFLDILLVNAESFTWKIWRLIYVHVHVADNISQLFDPWKCRLEFTCATAARRGKRFPATWTWLRRCGAVGGHELYSTDRSTVDLDLVFVFYIVSWVLNI